MEDSGLDRRIAYQVLSKRWATRSAATTLLAIGSIACLISLFVSNTATTAMLLPIGLTMLRSMNADRRGEGVAVSFLLMLTWGSSIAVGTIIGTPPNVLGVGLIEKTTGVQISFVDWAIFAMPITIALLVIAWLVLRRFGSSPPSTASASEMAASELVKLGPLSAAERNTMIAFGVAMSLWLIPGIFQYAFGSATPWVKEFSGRVPESVAALAGAFLLFLLPCPGAEGNRAMTWRSATRIEWGTILLFGGGIALGDAVFKSGLAEGIGNSLAASTGANETWTIAALSCALAIVLSELASNTAAATTVVPVAISLAQGAGVSPIPAALAATLGSNLGFMLPISTPPNAIVYSTGLVPTARMMRTGLFFDVVGFVVTMGSLYLILPAMGLDRLPR
jgi:sodium-dependent dicarboxylate transporter 2/3/5